MIFILYSAIDDRSIGDQLGQPEYSYYFVMRGFQQALEQLGEVHTLTDTGEALDGLLAELGQRGVPMDEVTLFCFSPPHKAPVDLPCRALTVLAWEFDTIPDAPWGGEPRNDWRTVFANHGRAISLSSYSTEAIRRAMGERFSVATIPVPVWDQFEDIRRYLPREPVQSGASLHVQGMTVDSAEFDLSTEALAPVASAVDQGDTWQGQPIHLSFSFIDPGSTLLSGFYAPEQWGAWSRTSNPSVTLPFKVKGRISLTLSAIGYGHNVGREILVCMGPKTAPITLGDSLQSHTVEFELTESVQAIRFSELDLSPVAGVEDRRTMAVGLRSVDLRQDEGDGEATGGAAVAEDLSQVTLDGVVYTSVFNPSDGRKNWEDIVTAFVWALRDREDATLVLKMSNKDPASFLSRIYSAFARLAPFKCRILVIHGYLDDYNFQQLIASTSYYISASHCEGLCLPLMEYLSCGKPAITPSHTAMADYIDESVAFTVEAAFENNVWPHDPREKFQTTCYRINWESLMTACRESYRVATEDPDRYRQMSDRAIEKMRAYSSVDSVKDRLRRFLKKSPGGIARRASRQ
jgi:glycosyltransferase involved in cell wall biosynthesis